MTYRIKTEKQKNGNETFFPQVRIFCFYHGILPCGDTTFALFIGYDSRETALNAIEKHYGKKIIKKTYEKIKKQ